jgi:hypothetical protein
MGRPERDAPASSAMNKPDEATHRTRDAESRTGAGNGLRSDPALWAWVLVALFALPPLARIVSG